MGSKSNDLSDSERQYLRCLISDCLAFMASLSSSVSATDAVLMNDINGVSFGVLILNRCGGLFKILQLLRNEELQSQDRRYNFCTKAGMVNKITVPVISIIYQSTL